MADTETQAPIVAAAQLGVDIAQAVVAGVATTKLQFHLAGDDVKFVMGHQNFFGRNFEETGQGADGLAREVHERLGRQQPNGVALHRGACHQPVVTLVQGQVDLELTRESL